MNPRTLRPAPLLTACLLALPRVLHADEYADFRIPDHTVSGTNASLFGTAERQRTNLNGFTSTSALERRYEGTSGGSGFWIHDSEPAFTAIEASLAGDAVRDALSSVDLQLPMFVGEPYMRTAREARNESARLRGTVDMTWRWYPGPSPLAIGFNVTALTQQEEDWERMDTRTETHATGFDESSRDQRDARTVTNDYLLTGGADVGVGRVRDATGVYRARLLEQRLRRRGVLARPLSAGAAAKLAALFYVEPNFGGVHDRPDKYFARELERILREDGALSDRGLDPAAFDLALEPDFAPGAPLGQVQTPRLRGFFAGATLDARHLHSIQREDLHEFSISYVDSLPPSFFDTRVSGRSENEANLVEAGPRAEFHRPLGMRWQFDAASALELAIPTAQIKSGLDAFVAGALTYTIADRWLATAQVAQDRSYVTPKNSSVVPVDHWEVRYGGTLQYYLEDRTVIQLGASSSELHDRNSSFFLASGYERLLQVVFAVTYHFSGSLAAPGLMSPSRLNPGGASF